MTNLTLETYRQQFPALANKAYFNYGGQGPLPQISLDAIYQSYEQVQQKGPFSGKAGGWVTEESAQMRDCMARELGVSAETITLTENVTVGCNIALWGIDWQPGDHLLLSDCEHPGIIAIIQELQRRFQVEVSVCPLRETLNQGDPVSVIETHLQPNTRLLVISHILWNTGQVLPLGEIVKCCHNHPQGKVRVLVDAAQSVGVLPLNLTALGVDFYAFTGHKWWCGPEGSGGLYTSPDALTTLSPSYIGWRSIQYDKTGTPVNWKPDARRYEVATSAYPLYAGLRRSIALHHEWGTTEERYQQICDLSQYLWQGLSELSDVYCLRTSPPEAGLVSFQLTNGLVHQAVVESLEKQNICVRTILNPDCIRACIHYFTDKSEIDRLVTAIATLNSSPTELI
ncbi:aminotransferase class V-fold PLP-dependent enzyme [Lyngbya sp. PCC 8106]|uniref:aminotransferase class V-fold PLP-dependent enzyme n=1 Tax=Lyngbya sp. (strain PCC 8106) TaxID=313612 RepID=UPI0000EA8C94|nr:aminotransferase class V-fold PLP-dependent enzyme [Lyngbya sp. PCC 8106]EAW36291.1 L-cysteine/cystine lyase [Lyngbya sp. PCC 8106]